MKGENLKMPVENRWNKKIFALLLEQAKGPRSWRQFAIDCDISYVQMRKLALMTQENPPRPKLIRKVAANAFGELDLEDFMFAAGMNIGESAALRVSKPRREDSMDEKYRLLSQRDRRTVNAFMDFLAQGQSGRSEKEH